MLRVAIACCCCPIVAAPLAAQMAVKIDAAQNPISAAIGRSYESIKGNILKSADEMPEADYAFKPTPAVRSYGELIAHVAQGEYAFCSSAKGDKMPAGADMKGVTAKADIVKGLQAAFAYCDGVYAELRDATLADSVTVFGRRTIRYVPLANNVSHANEHYGNIVTYLRLKNLVPPSSQKS